MNPKIIVLDISWDITLMVYEETYWLALVPRVLREMESPCDDPLVDDTYFSVLSDDDELFPISDEKYAEGLQLQEALMSSAISTQTPAAVAESSSSKPLFCDICMDAKTRQEMFDKNACSHFFCSDCISKHIAAKIHENINSITCPDLNCDSVLEPEMCRELIPLPVFDRWMDALCESVFLGARKFYCPFKDCSALLLDDGGEVVTQSECPNCRRLFCAQCRVPWHCGISCENFQSLDEDERGRDDIMLMELAKQEKWGRCPSCKFFVEKKDGCQHMSCRCGFHFCYGCGKQWSSTHGGCQRA